MHKRKEQGVDVTKPDDDTRTKMCKYIRPQSKTSEVKLDKPRKNGYLMNVEILSLKN